MNIGRLFGPQNPFIRMLLEEGNVDKVAQCLYETVTAPCTMVSGIRTTHYSAPPFRDLPASGLGVFVQEPWMTMARALVTSWTLRDGGIIEEPLTEDDVPATDLDQLLRIDHAQRRHRIMTRLLLDAIYIVGAGVIGWWVAQ